MEHKEKNPEIREELTNSKFLAYKEVISKGDQLNQVITNRMIAGFKQSLSNSSVQDNTYETYMRFIVAPINSGKTTAMSDLLSDNSIVKFKHIIGCYDKKSNSAIIPLDIFIDNGILYCNDVLGKANFWCISNLVFQSVLAEINLLLADDALSHSNKPIVFFLTHDYGQSSENTIYLTCNSVEGLERPNDKHIMRKIEDKIRFKEIKQSTIDEIRKTSMLDRKSKWIDLNSNFIVKEHLQAITGIGDTYE